MKIVTHSNYPGPGWTAYDDDRVDSDFDGEREVVTGPHATGDNEVEAIRALMDKVEDKVCPRCGEIFCEANH